MSLKIADIDVAAPVFLAPLAGVSDAAFRRLCREQGAAWVCSELVSSDGLIRGSQRTLDYLYFFPEERPVGVQLFGSDPGVMAEAARFVSSRPAELRIHYNHADDDLDEDGDVDLEDEALELTIGIWRQENDGDLFERLGSLLIDSVEEVEAELQGFSRYALAY